ncbi:IucA/IucC family siderophore biosynthesis protein [Peribacillus butanolivorans]|uniref:IucA/IucC family protein n=1 Tax=Peribacillus butanolivorans TaxID=421767 RepID=UPI00207C75FA|nr:IucA/IucC family siderophore biosynthesis protein [Peribacillus butanolivorans]MCO0596101.1 IucA/IucC family siderophore biosynthesis protein [Peribacillus butanolivorans]
MQFINEVEKAVTEKNWSIVNQNLLAKMISEYMYEDIIHPAVLNEDVAGNLYELKINEEKSYQFLALPRLFDSYDVQAESIKVFEAEQTRQANDAIQFILDLQPLIGMTAETTGHLIKEFHHTLLADLQLLSKPEQNADDLVELDYALLEGEMSGHPWIAYNKGRIGFGYDDYLKFAPENQEKIQLSWIAVHKTRGAFNSIQTLSYKQLMENELDDETRKVFANRLAGKGLKEEDYFYLPIHEWQWKNVIIQNFTDDLAKGLIVALGNGPDEYLPQQSIRTFVNVSNKNKHHVKLPMSILNTLVYRGLPAERTVIAPKITEYIKNIYNNDSFLKEECKVVLPGEVASLNVDHPYFSKLKNVPYQYLEMLGGIWRESIYSYMEEGEKPITLASLLHVDHEGKPYVESLIEKSGLTTEAWTAQLFDVILSPLLHFIYQYGVVFSPHGQNTILVLRDYKPHRLAIKDFVDDVNISDQPLPELSMLPDNLKKVLRSEAPEGLVQFIFTGLFICHFRYLSTLLMRRNLLDENVFWEGVARTILTHQQKFPKLQDRFETFNFFAPKLTKLCLNRNRMLQYGYSDGEDRPHASEFGYVNNALYEKLPANTL